MILDLLVNKFIHMNVSKEMKHIENINDFLKSLIVVDLRSHFDSNKYLIVFFNSYNRINFFPIWIYSCAYKRKH